MYTIGPRYTLIPVPNPCREGWQYNASARSYYWGRPRWSRNNTAEA